MQYVGYKKRKYSYTYIFTYTHAYPYRSVHMHLHMYEFICMVTYIWVSLMAQMVKNLPAIQETRVQAPGGEDPLEKGMATHSSILAWRIPWTEGPVQSMGSQSQTQRTDTKSDCSHSVNTYIYIYSHVYVHVWTYTLIHTYIHIHT